MMKRKGGLIRHPFGFAAASPFILYSPQPRKSSSSPNFLVTHHKVIPNSKRDLIRGYDRACSPMLLQFPVMDDKINLLISRRNGFRHMFCHSRAGGNPGFRDFSGLPRERE